MDDFSLRAPADAFEAVNLGGTVPRFAELGVINDLSPAFWFPSAVVDSQVQGDVDRHVRVQVQPLSDELRVGFIRIESDAARPQPRQRVYR